MHVLVTGGTGFIAAALVPALLDRGCKVTILSRQDAPADARCRYLKSLDDIGSAEPLDAVINLAGASLAARRWSGRYKQEIVDSRLHTTEAVLGLMARLDMPPAVLLNASAIGYYGHHGDEELTEEGSATPGFAQDLCQRWEDLALQAPEGVRVCLLRLGVVLDRDGGALQEMLQSFRLGVASWLGRGDQWLSWVHRQDVVAAMLYLLDHPELDGPFNLTAPNPVTAREFCEGIKRQRRTFLTAPLPGPVARVMLGEMADELLLNGQRVVPAALVSAGFEFQYPELDGALTAILAR